MTALSGVIPILATPFHDDESLDLESWVRLMEFMIELRVDGITIIGVLGESNRLSDNERARLIETAVATVNHRIPIVVGTSHSGTGVTEYLSAMAQQLGADAVMVTPLKEPTPSDDRIVEAFQRLGERVSIPIVLQDHPASSEVHMPVKLISRLLQSVPQIACIKEESVPTPPKIRLLREATQDRPCTILAGLNALYAPFDLEEGCDGLNTGFAFPEVLLELVNAARASDWLRVHRVYSQFAALIVFEQQPGVAIRKELLRRRGLLASARVRHPGANIPVSATKQLDALLARTLPGVDVTKPVDIADLVMV